MRSGRNRKPKAWFMGRVSSIEQAIGDESEKRFESMVHELMKRGSMRWAVGISKATLTDDILNGIDFWIRAQGRARGGAGATCEFFIPFQVKSSFEQARQFEKEKGSIVPAVVMHRSRSLRSLENYLWTVYVRKRAEQFKMASKL
jgi:hypothetical protein